MYTLTKTAKASRATSQFCGEGVNMALIASYIDYGSSRGATNRLFGGTDMRISCQYVVCKALMCKKFCAEQVQSFGVVFSHFRVLSVPFELLLHLPSQVNRCQGSAVREILPLNAAGLLDRWAEKQKPSPWV